MNIENARFNMIEQQVRPWKVFDDKILGAMASLSRENFVKADQRGLAYADTQLPLGHNQTMLAPREIARMIQALEITPEDKVLEIGTGSGYSSAILSKLGKRITSVEIIKEFVDGAKQIHKKLGLENVIVEEGDASDGWMAQAPYDAVLITSALPNLPESLKRNINEGGRIVSIIESETDKSGGLVVALSRLKSDNEWHHEYLFPINSPAMINVEKTNRFEF
ncbi:MAG: protein-L-isoaspartate O-methyltransferase family protein [Kangiellaceae bacterium]